jgi:hypothetical protein
MLYPVNFGGEEALRRYRWPLGYSLVLGVLLSACSGGGSSSALSVQGKTVYWAPPQTFVDNTPLVPSRDLLGYEIFVKQDPSFGPADSPVATASALDNTYNFGNISPPLSKGVTYYVTLRTVTAEGMKSDFCPPVSFSP